MRQVRVTKLCNTLLMLLFSLSLTACSFGALPLISGCPGSFFSLKIALSSLRHPLLVLVII